MIYFKGTTPISRRYIFLIRKCIGSTSYRYGKWLDFLIFITGCRKRKITRLKLNKNDLKHVTVKLQIRAFFCYPYMGNCGIDRQRYRYGSPCRPRCRSPPPSFDFGQTQKKSNGGSYSEIYRYNKAVKEAANKTL